ncbi:MAG: D-amino-acid transaminase [Bradyrhizobiaceae bacterium]|nr:D-amino-acid transaminase [Bradyrhizobiaceae bacterium]
MSRVAYVNGRYLPHQDAMVHVEDRGYQFSDGVYEVCEVRDAKLVDERRHLGRLQRSLNELRIRLTMPFSALSIILHETIRRNRVRDGILYLQVTRGVARRDHAFPAPQTAPSLVVTARNLDGSKREKEAQEGISVITLADLRWARVDIKSIALLPNVLAKQAAREQGAREAWLVDGKGFVTEGSSANAWIVTNDGKVVTRPADHGILRGISRTVVLDVIAALGLQLEERPFTVAETYAAREAFVTAASQIVLPVIRVDGRPVGNGRPGPIATKLRHEFHRYAEFS